LCFSFKGKCTCGSCTYPLTVPLALPSTTIAPIGPSPLIFTVIFSSPDSSDADNNNVPIKLLPKAAEAALQVSSNFCASPTVSVASTVYALIAPSYTKLLTKYSDIFLTSLFLYTNYILTNCSQFFYYYLF